MTSVPKIRFNVEGFREKQQGSGFWPFTVPSIKKADLLGKWNKES